MDKYSILKVTFSWHFEGNSDFLTFRSLLEDEEVSRVDSVWQLTFPFPYSCLLISIILWDFSAMSLVWFNLNHFSENIANLFYLEIHLHHFLTLRGNIFMLLLILKDIYCWGHYELELWSWSLFLIFLLEIHCWQLFLTFSLNSIELIIS